MWVMTRLEATATKRPTPTVNVDAALVLRPDLILGSAEFPVFVKLLVTQGGNQWKRSIS